MDNPDDDELPSLINFDYKEKIINNTLDNFKIRTLVWLLLFNVYDVKDNLVTISRKIQQSVKFFKNDKKIIVNKNPLFRKAVSAVQKEAEFNLSSIQNIELRNLIFKVINFIKLKTKFIYSDQWIQLIKFLSHIFDQDFQQEKLGGINKQDCVLILFHKILESHNSILENQHTLTVLTNKIINMHLKELDFSLFQTLKLLNINLEDIVKNWIKSLFVNILDFSKTKLIWDHIILEKETNKTIGFNFIEYIVVTFMLECKYQIIEERSIIKIIESINQILQNCDISAIIEEAYKIKDISLRKLEEKIEKIEKQKSIQHEIIQRPFHKKISSDPQQGIKYFFSAVKEKPAKKLSVQEQIIFDSLKILKEEITNPKHKQLLAKIEDNFKMIIQK